METLGDKILPKFCPKFYCNFCDYGTSKKSSYNDHLLSAKHQKSRIGDILETNGNINLPKICFSKFTCENCNKKYTSRNGLWKHSKNCKLIESTTQKDGPCDKELINKDTLIIELLKQNKELLEIVKNGTHNTTNNTNSHNKAFNLNFFLNETCKDAMNIMDFVDSIKLQLSDLEKVGELGYVEGISNIITKNLKELDVNKRPVHCTDKKRETMYIKDENKWEKDEEKLKLHKVVRKVAFKNQNLIPKFKEIHPDYNKYHSKVSDQYNKIIVESMGGPGDNDFEKEEKIIKNISKQVFIEKEEPL